MPSLARARLSPAPRPAPQRPMRVWLCKSSCQDIVDFGMSRHRGTRMQWRIMHVQISSDFRNDYVLPWSFERVDGRSMRYSSMTMRMALATQTHGDTPDSLSRSGWLVFITLAGS
jgi:hypothetical protein